MQNAILLNELLCVYSVRCFAFPLERRESKIISTITATRLLISAGAIHIAILLFFVVFNQIIGERSAYRSPERIKIHILDSPPPPVEPALLEEPDAIEGAVQPDFTPKKKEQKVEKKPKRKKPRLAQPSIREETKAPETAPEPIRHRIVGLNLESTVQGSGGPSFAIGTSRMGKTERRATDPKQASRDPAQYGPARPGGDPRTVREQRIATRIPTRDSVFVKPERNRPSKPTYPETLRAQGIEGDVLVRVDIDTAGNVVRVTVIKSSGYPGFDDAARKAALSERFSPATRDGKAVVFTLSYTYRFRIEDN